MLSIDDAKIGVVGLGYVGLPLAVEFGKVFDVVGFDINTTRIEELRRGEDRTLELTSEELVQAKSLAFTSTLEDLSDCNVYVITVPTPVDVARRPDFDPLLRSSAAIGSILKRGDCVIYESTVYPGVTEEVCVPVLEKASGLKFNVDFWCGYSPERINPGDKDRGLRSIVKVTSGSTPEVGTFVNALYGKIIDAGTHLASSIRVAEAAKVIENTQRDVNIALMNELAMIFNRIGISTQEVLAAAGTKWNFLAFQPGLVGGHCIGVDPYYLAHKAAMLGFHPELLLSARRINDGMGPYVAAQVMKHMARNGLHLVGSRILVLGLTFKENCPDLRNTRVVDVITELQAANAQVDVYDPWADHRQAHEEYGISLVGKPDLAAYDAVVLAVPHHQFVDAPDGSVEAYAKPDGVVFDVKGRLAPSAKVFQL
ncbi:nucleotide sugar dehydrogenase [Montanilutibacter psychrotolerans]|uniref:Nucleotide sugar dehydrogenase n=1 Tax=Montanilutibacter psychrotolerans TaxID=1327343 RepID=A0A3M8SSQ7_9GAMM|nr:nucleotide sugar dehydrogenase [Lysobacter psychrotolerans]RNF84358.1 nucleotide sugar dehydrogenase [Lysobacter psychrotolerans]